MFKLNFLRQCVQNVGKQSNVFKLNPVYLSTSAAKYDYDKDIAGKSFSTDGKKFFVDVKENLDGERYLKLSELSRGRRFTTRIDSVAVEELMKRLEKEKNFELDGAKGKKYIVSRLSNNFGGYVEIKEQNPGPEGRYFSFKISQEDLTTFLDTYESLKSNLQKNTPA